MTLPLAGQVITKIENFILPHKIGLIIFNFALLSGIIYATQGVMNNFKRLFLISILLCLAALAMAHFAGKRLQQRQPPQQTLWHESLTQLKEICRHKYRQSLRLIAYAHHAERDSLHAAAALFHAISHAEAVQCDNCRQAIESLGGVISLPTTTPTEFSNAESHLDNTLRSKIHVHTALLPHAIEQALKDNNRYIARMLTWCDTSDAKQIMLLQQQLLTPEERRHTRYRICPTCGDISWHEVAARHCPHCMTDSVKFFIVER